MSESGANTIESLKELLATDNGEWTYWDSVIKTALDAEKDWREQATESVEIYTTEKTRDFNILHSNVETVTPAMYNSRPVPDVRTRHNDNNDVARQASTLLERGLSYQLDEYDFDSMMEAICQDAYLEGRGQGRARWRTYITNDAEAGERITWEEAIGQHVRAGSFLRGASVTWDECSWIAYEHFMDRDQIVDLMKPQPKFDPINQRPIPPTPEEIEEAAKMAGEVPLDVTDQGEKSSGSNAEQSVFKRAQVWEIWDKNKREILFFCPSYNKAILRKEPDPLGLIGFFDCPEPVQPITHPKKSVPVCPYSIYKAQAEELSTISTRILKLIRVVKFRGIYASEIAEMKGLDTLEDGQFSPSEGAMAAMGGTKGLAEAVWVMPIRELVEVIRELVAQRDVIKHTIFELSGIADILRGATNPNETLGAQEIKANWGSLRIRKLQKRVEKWCREFIRITAEIIANKFGDQTLAIINGGEVPPDVMETLRNDMMRRYLVDVETDSTVRGDLARMQQNMNGFMAATGSFIGTFVPLMEKGMFPPELGVAAATVYSAFTRTFKLGKQVEDVLSKLEAAAQANLEKQKQDLPAKQQAQAEQEELNKQSQQLQLAGQEAEVRKTAAEAERAEAEVETVGMEFITKQAETAHKSKELNAKTLETMVKADESRIKSMDSSREADRKTAESLVDIDKAIAEIEKKNAETEAQRVETAMVINTGGKPVGPGFTG